MTITGQSTVVGVFITRANAERAINDLHTLGFTDEQIGYVVRNTDSAAGDIVGNAGA